MLSEQEKQYVFSFSLYVSTLNYIRLEALLVFNIAKLGLIH